jgi:proline iminopeptidase
MRSAMTIVVAALAAWAEPTWSQSGTAPGGGSQARVVPDAGAVPMPGWSATYVTEGTGLPCVVISLRHYHPRTFSPQFKGTLRCTFLDARFSVPEASADPKDPYTVAAAVEDLEAARKALGLNRFVLVGHSIQGSIALAYALRYPQHVSHVIAIGAVPGMSPALGALAKDHWDRNASQLRKAAFEAAQKSFAAAATGLSPAELPPAMIRADAAKRWYDPEYDERPLMVGVPFNMPVVSQLFGQPFDLFAGGARVEPPTFLALGRHDYVVPPAAWDGQSIHFRDVTIALFERAGHTPQVEMTAEFDEQVLAWLRSH